MTEPAPEPGQRQRLQKIIAAAGIASRRKAEELITEGRVQVNGQAVTELGTKADPAQDHIRVDGGSFTGPNGLATSSSTSRRAMSPPPTIPKAAPPSWTGGSGKTGGNGERVFPVGRLDYSSEGLLLMTNDGELANASPPAAPRRKTYLVKVSGKPSESAIGQLRHGS